MLLPAEPSLRILAHGTVPPAIRTQQTEQLWCLLIAKVVLKWLIVLSRNTWDIGTAVMENGQAIKKMKMFSVSSGTA